MSYLVSVFTMEGRFNIRKHSPEDYILSVLSHEDRLDAAFKIAREAFKGTKLTTKDIDNAVSLVRRKAYGGKK